MGYDTTLHLVDKRAFDFFEQMFKTPDLDDELMPELARRLDAGDPEAGRMLTEMRWGLDGVDNAYVATRDRMLVAIGCSDLRALPWSTIAALPRE